MILVFLLFKRRCGNSIAMLARRMTGARGKESLHKNEESRKETDYEDTRMKMLMERKEKMEEKKRKRKK